MKYDPIKNIFEKLIRKSRFLRVTFYKILDTLFLRAWYIHKELNRIRKNLKDTISVYDAGCGFGQYTYFISKKLQPCTLLSVDIKENWIDNLKPFFKNNENITFKVEDITEINYTNKFDLILCVDVIEHIVNDQKVFNNFSNALKDNGYVVISTPSIYGGSDAHEEDDESFIEEHARNGYSYEDIKSKAEKAGLEIENFKFSYGKFGTIAWRLAIKYPILLVNLSKIFIFILPFYYLLTIIPILSLMFLDINTNNKVGTGIIVTLKKNQG
ncbi:MAG TPA: methyltransferase domain-containing protein [Ignavibacteriales bacterium]|jgi:2-polyprenyl-3-methyl-5-hydroxy-6-metoxy-1,4-benzoquinol methylase|nr:methyltransferase domain-containing protein [Ignavibacteriales bacterium]